MSAFIVSIMVHWLLIILAAPLFSGIIVKVKAFWAGRIGPSVFQPYFDLLRLLQKKSVYSRTTTWIFRIAPVVALAVMLIVALFLPLGSFKAPVQFANDIILAVYLLALARFFMMAAAMDTGFSMEGMGASREAFFACLSELALFMNFITLALLAGTPSLSQMIGADVPVSWNAAGPALLLVVVSLFVLLLAENCRIPVDDPDTHLELTMIHEVMILDHSGVDLAYVMQAAFLKLVIFAGILLPILIPVSTGNFLMDMAVFLAGMLGMAVLIGCVESSMARLRLNRVRNLLLAAFALSFFGFIVTVWRA